MTASKAILERKGHRLSVLRDEENDKELRRSRHDGKGNFYKKCNMAVLTQKRLRRDESDSLAGVKVFLPGDSIPKVFKALF